MVCACNERGLAALDPRWAGGAPRLISDQDAEFIVTAATTRPEKLGLPFTCWSLRKLAAYLAGQPARLVRIGRERLPDPAWIEHVTSRFPDRYFAFEQFGPLSIRPAHGTAWTPQKHPRRLPATYHRTHGIRYFHGCYSLADDQLRGVAGRRKGGDHSGALQPGPGEGPRRGLPSVASSRYGGGC